MASILKVDSIRGSGQNADSITLDGSGNITFNKTVTGDNAAMVKLLNATISSPVSEYVIDSTHINSTYDKYQLLFSLMPASDGPDLFYEWYTGGSVFAESASYGWEVMPQDTGGIAHSDSSQNYGRTNRYGIGNASGEGIQGSYLMMNVNDTNFPVSMCGRNNYYGTGGVHYSDMSMHGVSPAYRATVMNGFRLRFSSGNIASGTVQLYGIKQ